MTLAEQVAHYAQVRRRLYGQTERRKRWVREMSPPKEYREHFGPPNPLLMGFEPWMWICNEVTRKTGVTYERMRQTWDRRLFVCRARSECWARMRMECGMSYAQIGACFEVERSAVSHAIARRSANPSP